MNEEGLPDNDTLASRLTFPVVGLGGSAGGINALLRFFQNMPAQPGMAFVVVMHLSPKHKSNIAHILQNVTSMPVTQVTQTAAIEQDHVYVIPPSHILSMNDGCLRLEQMKRPLGRHVAIDIFFRTLGDAHKERAIAVIMSGMGADGAVGLARIKEQGGITIAQSPTDAEYDSMPFSAIETGKVDLVLPAVDIPQKLMELWENARKIRMPQPEGQPIQVKAPPSNDEALAAEEALQEIIALLRTRTGHDFHYYKRATILRRIERRLQVNRLQDIPSYRNYLKEHSDETPALLDDLLIGVTNFFRDRESFEALERDVIPEIIRQKALGESARVWVPGCATGEEAYSIAMLLREQVELVNSSAQLQVFATEIDEAALAAGREGLYPESIVTDITPARLRQFFVKENRYYRIKKEVRETVLFAAHNILRDPPFSKLDLISCRNLLIYLDRDVHRDILETFHFALRPGGFLFLGNSETADSAATLFAPVDKKNRIYRANALNLPGRTVPHYPLGPQRKWAPKAVAASEKRKVSFTELHQRLLQQYAPPSVLINRELEIVHLSERAGRFLNFVGGEPSHKLLAVVNPELRLELRTALFEAMQTNKSVEARRVHLPRDGRTFYVNMIVRPVQEEADQALPGNLILVLFDEVEETMSAEGKTPRDGCHDPMVLQLENELQHTKERLQATIEQYETSTEELKVSNEELQAINEELRSTTEELETSKEELQSINEELVTVNQELKVKVDETGEINNDLQNLIASTDIATIFVDRQLRIKRFTPQATRVFNIIESDLGRSLLDITHRLDYAGLTDDANQAFETLRPIEHEVAGNNGRWYLARVLPYRTLQDRVEGAVLTFIDITSRRQAEERVREGEERIRLVVESTNDYAIMTLDDNGVITSWNKGGERIFGWTESEAVGQSVAMLFVRDDLPHAPTEEMRKARTEGRAEDERWHIRKDGTTFYCSGVMTVLNNGGVRSYAKIARDATGLKRAEIEREALLKHEKLMSAEAQVASELKDEFLAIMSHELKNPLNLIHVNAELLARLPETKSAPAVLRVSDIIKRAVVSQAQIIDDLLDLSRLRTGKLVLNCVSVALHDMMKIAVEVLRSDAEGRQIDVVFEAPPGDVLVFADPVRVEQMIWNLFSNALKFTPAGGCITVKITTDETDAILEVADTGIGIEQSFLHHIFDMFRQADARTTRQHGGLGIGLALVRHLVDLHGGRVEVSSPGVGNGTTFQLRLPLHHKAQPQTTAARSNRQRAGMAGVRILVVDDDRQTMESLGTLMQLEHAQVTTAASAGEALGAVETQEFDLIFSDIAMPVTDGYQLLKKLRALPQTAAVPVIAITGFSRPRDVRRILDSGFAGYICKPIAIDNLFDIATNLLVNRKPNGGESSKH